MLIGQGFRLVGEERFNLGMEVSFVNPAYFGFAGTPEAARRQEAAERARPDIDRCSVLVRQNNFGRNEMLARSKSS